MPPKRFDPETLGRRAAEVAGLLRVIANARRLAILCRLVEEGEVTPTALAASVGLSAPALSQHLAKMRSEGLVRARRDGQMLWYRIDDPRLERVFTVLHDEFCTDDTVNTKE